MTASFVLEAAGMQGALAICMLMAAPWQHKGGCVRSTPTKAWQQTWGQLWAPVARRGSRELRAARSLQVFASQVLYRWESVLQVSAALCGASPPNCSQGRSPPAGGFR